MSRHVVRKPSPTKGTGRRLKGQHTGASQRYDAGSLPSRPGSSAYPHSQSGGYRGGLVSHPAQAPSGAVIAAAWPRLRYGQA
jgi:hypothetical protein